jgi:ubiquinone/menaquinone biosynthesis C-methylase UbiE
MHPLPSRLQISDEAADDLLVDIASANRENAVLHRSRKLLVIGIQPRLDCPPQFIGSVGFYRDQSHRRSLPDAERPAQRDQLAEMIRVVIGDEQDRAQVRLLPLAGRDCGEQIHLSVADQQVQLLAIGLEIRNALVPRRRARWRGTLRPVILRPLERVDVLRIDTEVEEILLRYAHVLEELPRCVLEACGVRSALVRCDTIDGLVKADVGLVPVKEAHQLRAERVRGFVQSESLCPKHTNNGAARAYTHAQPFDMSFYERRILPHIINLAMNTKVLQEERARCLQDVKGVALEIGFGTGLNLPHYPQTVTKVVGVDPSEMSANLARKRITASPFPVETVGLSAEKLPVTDGSFESIVSTFTLCTIPDVSAALFEVRRALAPGGRFYFVEHGRAEDPKIERWQHRLNSMNQRLLGGCNLTRPIAALIEQAGFEIERLEKSYMKDAPKFAGFLYRGVAKRIPRN